MFTDSVQRRIFGHGPYIHRGNVRSGVKVNPNRCSKQGFMLREQSFGNDEMILIWFLMFWILQYYV